jgi:hypothetical protein
MHERQYLYTNLALGALTAFSNSAASAIMLNNSSRIAGGSIFEALLYATFGYALVVIGALAVMGRIAVVRALKYQAIALTVLLTLLTLWGWSILISMPNREVRIAWMLGMLSALGVYIYFLVRKAIPEQFAKFHIILTSVCLIAIVTDLSVFAKLGFF